MSIDDERGQAQILAGAQADDESYHPEASPLLVALAQNGALRLRCERAFVTLIAAKTQSIAVEVTPLTSSCRPPQPEKSREHGKSWPFIAAFVDPTGSGVVETPDIVVHPSRLVVRDMRLLDQYKDCAYVAEPHGMISLAEVPIKSESGKLLGTYAVMDNTIRDDFFLDETSDVLRDVAFTITKLLELRACAAEPPKEQTHMSVSPVPSQNHQTTPTTTEKTENPHDCPPEIPQPEPSNFVFPLIPADCDAQHLVFSKVARQISAVLDLEGLAFLDSHNGDEDLDSTSPCELLGGFVVPDACDILATPSALSESSLNYLTHNYPQGCAFLASHQGITVLSEANPSRYINMTNQLPLDLRSLVHKAQSLIFFPLWDPSAQQSYAGMLGWSRQSTRSFTRQCISCLSAFGKCFMMELGRTEIAEMEGTKSDFVASISHELRSPLHGCLTAVEFLQDTKVDNTQRELIEMIQACALTLLDTLNHLLDFSRISDLSGVKNRTRKESNVRPNHSQNTFGSTNGEYLCTILQDVVEGVHFGRSSQQAAHAKAKTSIDNLTLSTNPVYLLDNHCDADSTTSLPDIDDVAIYLDVENNSHWCTTLPAGAWKRLVMNLFGNALKFTTEGFVEVSMRLVEDHESETQKVHLKINDTGIGMSEQYMKHHLYQPFVQESYLTTGVGLGLSIVKQIVDDLGGTISVKSTPGQGTRFDVFVPLDPTFYESCQMPIPTGGEILDPDGVLRGLTLCVLVHDDESTPLSNARPHRTAVMQSYIQSIAEGWFGMNVVTAQSKGQVAADIYIAEALHYPGDNNDSKSTWSSDRKPLILVGSLPRHENTIKLAYPLGPKSLGRALLAALELAAKPGYSGRTISSSPSPEAAVSKELIGLPDPELIVHQPEIVSPTTHEAGTQQESSIPEHVLLVDDNSINLRLLAAYVKKLGISAELAVDGEDALEKYKAASTRNPFTTIFMDISMPKMNGFESSRAIRAHEAKSSVTSPTRIIALTGLGSDTSRREAEMSGMDDFRTKPVALKALKELLCA